MSNPILFTNAWLADGSGLPFRKGNLLMEGDRIRDLGENLEAGGAKKIDCADLVIAPGFIDAHSHSDLQVLYNKPEKIKQGVTSEVVGNCGFSPYPNAHAGELHEFGNGILSGDGEWGWKSAADYLLTIHERAKLASVASLIGHGSLRIAHAGLTQGATDEPTLAAMEGTLDEALAQGATGFSTGLMYAPGSSAPREELVRLCQVVARRNKIYCTHMRDYSTHLLEALDEQIDLARAAECKLQISHLQTVGRDNWKLNALALERIERARDSGVDIMFDCYPYVAGSTVLTQLLPQWALDGGIPKLSERLSDASIRREIEKQILDKMVHEWSDIFISAVDSQANADVVGKSLAEISVERNDSPLNIVFNLLLEEQGKVNMLQFNQSEENLHANLAHPLSIIISDGFYVKGKPHPRLHGTFPELLGNVCRDKGWLTLPGAIHKVTGSPAERFSIKDRGLLKPGYLADITIFDQALIRSHSTYKDPELDPAGVLAVLREGKMLLANDPRFHLN
jgi:dihydroorotase/N-acyl-D-amino-acid deacylase